MTKEELQRCIDNFSDNSPLNYCGTASGDDLTDNNYAKNNVYIRGAETSFLKDAIPEALRGMRFYQKPIFSAVSADAPGFAEIQKPELVGSHHLLPTDWLPEAKTVISFFLPFEKATVEANKKDPVKPAIEWLFTRVDGQRFLLALGTEVCRLLTENGYKAIAPYTDDRFVMRVGKNTVIPGEDAIPAYSSNWSERHVGVVCGLGTFGLSTNFISRAGCAGRLISIVTDWVPEYDVPDYTDWLGYCNKCGACIRRCPAQAHFKDKVGKDHEKCGGFIGKICKEFTPRYGCGKCQSGIPCEYKPMKPKA